MFERVWDSIGVVGVRFEELLGVPVETGLPFWSNIWNKNDILLLFNIYTGKPIISEKITVIN